jgi:hypothetical protein
VGALVYSAIRIVAYAPLLLGAMRPGRGFEAMMRAGRELSDKDPDALL